MKELLRWSDVIKIVTLAPEIPGVLDLVDRLRENGIRISAGHSDASDDEARAAFEHGMRQVTHTFNCMSSAHRRGIYRVAGLLEFAMSAADSLRAHRRCHHVLPTLDEMLYARRAGRNFSCHGCDAGAVLPNESHFRIGGRECVCVMAFVCCAGSALAGSASRMIVLLHHVRKSSATSRGRKMATENPRGLGLDKSKGCLMPDADRLGCDLARTGSRTNFFPRRANLSAVAASLCEARALRRPQATLRENNRNVERRFRPAD